MSHLLSSVIKEVEPVLNRSKEWSDIFLPRGRPLEPGELLVQRDLAQTLKIIQKQGRDGFYKGQVGHEIVQHLQKNGGLLAEEDFEEHTSTWVKPAKAEYHECTVHVNPPNSQAIIILLWLNMLDELQDISSYECFATDYIHLMVEAGKLAYRERDGYISDPDMSDIPTDRLLSKNYAQGLVKKVDKDRAMTRSSNPYKIDCDKGDTTYFAVVDKERNCVSCIQSLYFDFGSGVVGGRSGVILQNRGAYFSLDTGHHNCLSPRKRTFHTLCASLTLKDDHPYIVFGSMGGDVQPQIHVQVLTKLLDFNMDIQEAIEAPRWAMLGTIYQPDENLYLEKRFPNGVVDGLKEKGHGIIMMPELWDVTGHAQGVVIDPKGALKAGADPRGDGAAIGY